MLKTERLLGIEPVREWIETFESRQTQKNYLSKMSYLLDVGVDLEALLKLPMKEARELVWRIIKDLKDRGDFAKSDNLKYAVKSFYDFHNEDTPMVWIKRLHRTSRPPKKEAKKIVPSHDQVWRWIDSCRITRDMAIVSLMYNSGLGHQAISCINYGDVIYSLQSDGYPKEIVVTAKVYPKRFRINEGATSYRVLYDRDCAKLIEAYLKESEGLRREYMGKYKVPIDETPLFLTQCKDRRSRCKRMAPWGIWNVLTEVIKRKGQHLGLVKGRTWTYLIRDAYYNRLIAGGMKDVHREYLMGHSLGIRQHYYWNQYSNEMKEQYLACGFNRVEPIEQRIEESEVIRELREENRRLRETMTLGRIKELIKEQLKTATLE